MSLQQQRRPQKTESNFVGAMGNFSIQYNLSAASIALPFLQSHPAFAPPKWVHYVGLGAIFVGAVLGMIGMGYLGDALGRKRAMVVTLGIQVAGAVACSLLTWGSVETIYTIFCAGRLLLGIGVGGMYPLSASHSAEGSSEGEDAGARVGWAFFWQTPGSMAPYAVGLLLVLAVGDKQCSYFEHQDTCSGATLPTTAVATAFQSQFPLADRPSGAYCCGKTRMFGEPCADPDVSMLVAQFSSLTKLKLGIEIDGQEHDCSAETIHYDPATHALTFPNITQDQDCLGKIDSSNGRKTPTVTWDAIGDALKVNEGNATMVLKKGSCGAGPAPPPPTQAMCAWNASGNDICGYVETAPTFMPSLEYRLITGLGIIPPLIVMASAISSMQDSQEFQAAKRSAGSSSLAAVFAHPEHFVTLLGTGGTWFLYGASPPQPLPQRSIQPNSCAAIAAFFAGVALSTVRNLDICLLGHCCYRQTSATTAPQSSCQRYWRQSLGRGRRSLPFHGSRLSQRLSVCLVVSPRFSASSGSEIDGWTSMASCSAQFSSPLWQSPTRLTPRPRICCSRS